MDPMTNPDTPSVKTVAAKEAKQAFGQLLDDAQREPVLIERNGRPVAVVLSVAKYEIFQRLEDAHRGKRASRPLGFPHAVRRAGRGNGGTARSRTRPAPPTSGRRSRPTQGATSSSCRPPFPAPGLTHEKPWAATDESL